MQFMLGARKGTALNFGGLGALKKKSFGSKMSSADEMGDFVNEMIADVK